MRGHHACLPSSRHRHTLTPSQSALVTSRCHASPCSHRALTLMMPLSSRHRLTLSNQVVTPRALQGLLILTLTLTPRWLRHELSKAFESWVRVRGSTRTSSASAGRSAASRCVSSTRGSRSALRRGVRRSGCQGRHLEDEPRPQRLVHAGVAFAFDRWREAWTSVKRRQMMSFVRKMFAGDLARRGRHGPPSLSGSSSCAAPRA